MIRKHHKSMGQSAHYLVDVFEKTDRAHEKYKKLSTPNTRFLPNSKYKDEFQVDPRYTCEK